jgi:hypothetical protein
MGSEYFKNCRKGWIWTLVRNFEKHLTIFYLETYRRLTSHIIEFLKIISEKDIQRIFRVLMKKLKKLKNWSNLNIHLIENCILKSPKIIDFIINFNMSKTTPCIFQRGSFVQILNHQFNAFYKF